MLDLLPDLGTKISGGLRILQHDKAGIVARKRPKHFRDIQLIDCSRCAVCKTGHSLDDDHVLCIVHAGNTLPEDQIQLGRESMFRRFGCSRIPINAVRPQFLDDAQLLDVAGNGSLRGRETGLVQLSEQLLLRLDAVVCDKLQNFFLAFCLHRRV